MILFLHGPDTYRVRQKLKEIQEQYRVTYPNAVHVWDFDCIEADVEDAKNAVEMVSMFEKKKLIVFWNVFQDSAFQEFLTERKNQLAESEHHIVVLVETEEIKEKSTNKLYQWLKKNAKQQEFLLLSPAQLKLWIEQEFRQYNLKIAPRAQETLARSAGNNLWRLSGEVRKIAAWKKPASNAQVRLGFEEQVKEVDVTLFVNAHTEADIFLTIDSIAQKNKKRALSLLYKHLQKGDSPHYLFTMLVYQFRNILQIRDMTERKLSYDTMLRRTKLHPYVLKKGLRVAQNFSLQELKILYKKLFVLDTNLKIGKVEPVGVFDLFIARL